MANDGGRRERDEGRKGMKGELERGKGRDLKGHLQFGRPGRVFLFATSGLDDGR
jgi:hypothetical protein